jgi:hypothetical protein
LLPLTVTITITTTAAMTAAATPPPAMSHLVRDFEALPAPPGPTAPKPNPGGPGGGGIEYWPNSGGGWYAGCGPVIAMARCLLRKPEVLLLDEPTENLDADQRTRLTRVIREYARNRTCIVVSHDMDFIAAVADRIIVLNGGRVAEEGTHAELLANDGLYKRLYSAQNVDPRLTSAPSKAAAAPRDS